MRPLNLLSVLYLIALFGSSILTQSQVYEHSIKFENTSTATLVGEDGVIMKTTDNGQNWAEQTSGVTNVLYGNTSLDSSTSFAVGENGLILKTTDGGTTWVVKTSPTIQHFYDVEAVGLATVVACGDNGTVVVSTDAGESWSSVNLNTTNVLTDIAFFGDTTGYIIGHAGTLIKSTNSGLSWEILTVPTLGGNLNSISAKSALNLTAVGFPGIILNSFDGGATWQPTLELLPPIVLNEVVFFSENDGMIVGNDGYMIKTLDGGLTWHQSNAPVMVAAYDIMSVSFSSMTSGICVGEDGLKIYSTDGGETWTDFAPGILDLPTHRTLKQISKVRSYPNPFNPATKISFVLPVSGNVKVAVYDISGKEVSRLFDGYTNSGTHEFVFDAANLSSGLYFYTISGEGIEQVTNKMILIK